MGTLTLIFAILAGLCLVMGIITATRIIKMLSPELTWMFWFMLASILFLASISLV
jgi:hypothetical protein